MPLHELHWSYFDTLEQDLATVGRYVEICSNNFKTFSTEFTRLLLATCSEVDAVARVTCHLIQPSLKPKELRKLTIADYASIILSARPDFHTTTVRLERYKLDFSPWASWATAAHDSPSWWRHYNKVKHNRDTYYERANLENVLNAMAGLFELLSLISGGRAYAAHSTHLFRKP